MTTDKKKCPHCGGFGSFYFPTQTGSDNNPLCDTCKGKGEVADNKKR